MSNNIEVLSAVHGIAPRSDELLRLGGDVDRGRVRHELYEARLEEETTDWLNLQAEAGIDLQENGKLRWQDHLRPIVKATNGFADGIDEAPVTRWFETNTFYRKPTILGRLHFDPDRFEAEVGELSTVVSLLAPRAFSNLCDNKFEDLPAERNIFQLYSELFFYFEAKGVKRVVFEDYQAKPSNLFSPDTLSDAKVLASWCPDLQISLISPGQTKIAIPFVPITNLSVEVGASTLRHFRHQPPYARPDLSGAEIWQQAIDTKTTLEDKVDIDEWSLDALRVLKPGRLILTHSVDCERLPLSYAQSKVKHLGEIAAELRQKIEEEL